MIPKVIHYCWFGKGQLPDSAKRCIESWRKKAPNYQIIQWDESNFDLNSTPQYVQQAYQCKKWAFVTDYVRLKVVFEQGGIYLDTDVELKRNFNSFLKYSAFFGREDSAHVNTGLGFGAEKGCHILSDLMKDYQKNSFIKSNGTWDITPCPKRNRHVFEEYGLMPADQKQVLRENILVLPTIYMCPFSYQTGRMRHSFRTVSIHWFNASWQEKSERDAHWKYARKNYREIKIDRIKHFPNRVLIKVLGQARYSRVKKVIKSILHKSS